MSTVSNELVPDEPDSIGIALPREWLELPVERAEFDRFCNELRAGWAADSGWDRATQRRAELLLARIRRDIVRAGIQFIGLYVASAADADADANAGDDEPIDVPPLPDGGPQDPLADDVLMATCTVGTYTKESLGAKAPLTLGNLTMAFGRRPDAESDGPTAGAGKAAGPQYKRIVNVEPPMFHELPIGKSVRLRRLYELLEPGDLPQRFYGESFLTPLDDAGERCSITHFTTINLGLARVFSELFEAVAGTITHFGPEDPTTFSSDWVDLFAER